MKLEYTIEDVKSAFKFAKDNVNSTFKEWENHNNVTLTDNERKFFSKIKMISFDISLKEGNGKLHLINYKGESHNFELLDVFIRKFFKNQCYHFFGTEYTGYYLLVDENLLNLDSYDKNVKIKNLYSKELNFGETSIVITNTRKMEEYNCREYEIYKNNLNSDLSFYNNYNYEIYIKGIKNLELKPVLPLFE